MRHLDDVTSSDTGRIPTENQCECSRALRVSNTASASRQRCRRIDLGTGRRLTRTSVTTDPGKWSDLAGRITAVSTSSALSSSPDVVLKEGMDWTNITFKGKGFAWVNHPENRAMIKAHYEEREALLATARGVYEAGWATKSSAWVRVQLELADPEEVFELLEEAWRMTATTRAIKAYDEALGA